MEKYTNKLIGEASPYLLAHAHNPVNWYPWGEEAFRKAVEEDKPIFLSIGYSTCHWCHVMERETFDREEFAPYFNDNFIAIKVDREERPDVDNLYMGFTQALTGQGGWPMNVFLTPDQIPFYAATYIPPRMRNYSPGIIEILEGVKDLYDNRKDDVKKITDTLLNNIEMRNIQLKDIKESMDTVEEELYDSLDYSFDEKYGGFSSSMKFPTPQNLLFLIDYSRLAANEGKRENALKMVEKTVESIYRGGIFDHIGGGISRYSVDKFWLVPHFEKMLYDNGFLMQVLAKLYICDGKELYRRMYYKIYSYLEEILKRDDGLFYSAEDADSEGKEGKFYIFTHEEIKEVLCSYSTLQDVEEFIEDFKITSKGNFEGKNILNLINSKIDVFKGEEMKYSKHLNALKEYRDKRVRPFKDEKVILSWNSMAVKGLLLGSIAFNDSELKFNAINVLEIILKKMKKEYIFLTSIKDDISGPEAILDDYAYLLDALISAFEVTMDYSLLEKAESIFKYLMDNFYDDREKAFTIQRKDRREIIINTVDSIEAAVPSGNSVMAMVLYKLSLYLHDEEIEEIRNQLLERFKGQMVKMPFASAHLINSKMLGEKESELLLVTLKDDEDISFEKLKRLIIKASENGWEGIKEKDINGKKIQMIKKDNPLVNDNEFLSSLDYSGLTVYRCSNRGCQLPVKLKNE